MLNCDSERARAQRQGEAPTTPRGDGGWIHHSTVSVSASKLMALKRNRSSQRKGRRVDMAAALASACLESTNSRRAPRREPHETKKAQGCGGPARVSARPALARPSCNSWAAAPPRVRCAARSVASKRAIPRGPNKGFRNSACSAVRGAGRARERKGNYGVRPRASSPTLPLTSVTA
eukprot:scaffold39_cov493-Prasinococcus_capsulatus_cf.AAC.4